MREITVYNTMTRQKEVFNPVTPGEAKMYAAVVLHHITILTLAMHVHS